MSSKPVSIREQVDQALAARIGEPVLNAGRAWTLPYETLYGLDGSTVEQAVEVAYTPSGPSREVLRAGIEYRRAHRDHGRLPAGVAVRSAA